MGDDRDNSATAEGGGDAGNDGGGGADARPAGHARRGVLMLGAVAASSVVTIRPALAQTAASVMNCKIPVPDPPRAGHWIDPQGKLVPISTPGAFPSPGDLTGEQVRGMIAGRTPAGVNPSARDAYVRYIQSLRPGTAGFTCFQSLQMPRP